MQTVRVREPGGGREWAVRVVWQPRWRALARRFGGWRRKRKSRNGYDGGGLDTLFSFGDDVIAAILVIIAMILFGLLFWFLLLPLLLLVVDALVVILLLLLAIPARILFRRPWTVEASSPDPDSSSETWFATNVVGWGRALQTRDEIAQRLKDGHHAPIVGELATRES